MEAWHQMNGSTKTTQRRLTFEEASGLEEAGVEVEDCIYPARDGAPDPKRQRTNPPPIRPPILQPGTTQDLTKEAAATLRKRLETALRSAADKKNAIARPTQSLDPDWEWQGLGQGIDLQPGDASGGIALDGVPRGGSKVPIGTQNFFNPPIWQSDPSVGKYPRISRPDNVVAEPEVLSTAVKPQPRGIRKDMVMQTSTYGYPRAFQRSTGIVRKQANENKFVTPPRSKPDYSLGPLSNPPKINKIVPPRTKADDGLPPPNSPSLYNFKTPPSTPAAFKPPPPTSPSYTPSPMPRRSRTTSRTPVPFVPLAEIIRPTGLLPRVIDEIYDLPPDSTASDGEDEDFDNSTMLLRLLRYKEKLNDAEFRDKFDEFERTYIYNWDELTATSVAWFGSIMDRENHWMFKNVTNRQGKVIRNNWYTGGGEKAHAADIMKTLGLFNWLRKSNRYSVRADGEISWEV